MQDWRSALTWSARLLLLGIVILAIAGVVYPSFRPTEVVVRPDQVSHAALVYALTVATAVSFPRLSPWIIAIVFALIAIAVELAQLLGIAQGHAHVSDLVADAAGIMAAIIPIAVVRARRARLSQVHDEGLS